MTVDEIYSGMAARFQEETGLVPAGDGDLAVRLYAVAAQIYALYVQADWVERQCFPQSAHGAYLDKHAQLRGLERREAVRAQGVLRFETLEDVVLQAGETAAQVRAQAVEPGSAGNAAAGTIRAMAVAPVGVSRCTNPAAFAGGLEEETDEALRVRVLETFQRMPNGANAAFYQQGAMSFPEVAAAAVLSRPRGVGTVDVVVSTPAGVPDSALLAQLSSYFTQRREIAVDVRVRAPEVKSIDVSVAVAAADGADGEAVRSRVEAALRAQFDGRLLGRDVLRAALGAVIYGVDGVANYNIAVPAADVTAAADELPVLGTLTVTEMEVSG